MLGNWRENLRAAIGMAGLIDDVESGRTPADFFKMGVTTADGHVAIRRLRMAIGTFGSDEVLDECISAFLQEARESG